MAHTPEYRYTNELHSCSHEYLLPAVIRMLGGQRGSILDLGCGNGWIANSLLGLGYDVYGVDASASGIQYANSRGPGRFHLMEIGDTDLPQPLSNMRFDTVLSTEVIEHLYDPRALLRLAKTILGSKGRLIISTPYHGYLKNLALALSGRMDQHFTADWDGGHIKFFSRPVLERLLLECQFQPVKFLGAGRAPYLWNSMLIEARISQ